ncbi:MAG: IclR family transcriptional regulator [Gammaproteobacteria bacterium]|nr:IclR family transcriptional regulator [Gammaproteobacteria bacterium]
MNIQSVQRATDIISLFCKAPGRLGITEIATALRLNKGTVWGLVTTLERQQFLQQDAATRKYGVGPRLFELGMVYVGGLEINARAARHAQALADLTRLNARVGIWDHGSVLITFLAVPRSEDLLSHQIGPRVPAYCSAIGKALLANLDAPQQKEYLRDVSLQRHTRTTLTSREALRAELQATRERGYSISREEMIPGLAALGAPIFGRNRALAGAISISEAPRIVLGKRSERLGYELGCTAADISREMGYNPT